MSKRATIKSIAADLGISHMTVSRALSGHPNVQKSTREMVLRRARELGYVRSAAAGAMRGEDTRIIGLLLPNLINDFYARFANTMALACEARAHQLIIHLSNDDAELEAQALARLGQVQATAVVMVPTPGMPADPPPASAEIRIVQLIRQREALTAFPSLLVDDAPAIGEAVRYLAERGHRHVGYIGGADTLSTGKERFAAFRGGLAAVGLDLTPDLVHTGPPSSAFGERAARALVGSPKATALVNGGFEISSGALNAFMNTTAERPEFEMIGYGDPPHHRWLAGGISAIAVPVDELAQEAVDLAVGDEPPATLSYAASFVPRQGTAAGS